MTDISSFLPVDKSSFIRGVLFSLLTDETTILENIQGIGEDSLSALKVVESCGKTITRSRNQISITGKTVSPTSVLDCGNSATTMRLAMATLGFLGKKCKFTGDESLMSRDQSHFITAAALYGISIIEIDGHYQLNPIPGHIHCIVKTSLPVQSAQLKSFHLILMMKMGGRLKFDIETRAYTEKILNLMGASIKTSANKIVVQPIMKPLHGISFVPGADSSSAFIALSLAALKGTPALIRGVLLDDSRIEPFHFLKEMGYNLSIVRKKDDIGEVKLSGRSKIPAKHFILNQSILPKTVDEVPFLALLAVASGHSITVEEAGWLRSKESDRISVTVNLLRAICKSQEKAEGFHAEPAQVKKKISLSHSSDHRMEMLAAMLALFAGENFQPNDSVSVSFPKFRKLYETLRKNYDEEN